jgi:hypothetical protein
MTEQAVDLAAVLGDLGVEVKRVSGDEIQGRCPVHHLTKGRESSRFSWYMNSDSGLYHCFTCGARGNLPILISQMTGNPDTILAVQGLLINNSINRITRDEEWEEPEVEADWNTYAQFSPLPEAILELRQLDKEVAARFGIRWGSVEIDHETGRTAKMIIIPVVSPIGKLMGWQAKKTGIYLNIPTGVHKAQTLFGIERAVSRTALLVESPLDVVRFVSSSPGTDIAPLASFGANVSDEQLKLISTRFDKLIVALDNPHRDVAGRMEMRRLHKLWPSFRKGLRYWDYSHTQAKDIGDMTDEEIRCGIHSTTVLCP